LGTLVKVTWVVWPQWLSESPEISLIETPSIPTQLIQQPGSGENRIVGKAAIGFAILGEAVFPTATNTLEQNYIAASALPLTQPVIRGHVETAVKAD